MLSPASIAWACSRSPSILIVMPVCACSSRSLSSGRGPIWLASSSTRTVLRFALNSPLLDHRQQRREGVGPADAGVLQGVGLAPGHRGTDHLAALRR